MKRVSTHEAKTHLSKLIAEVLRGEEVVILRGDQPVARLTAYLEPETESRLRPRVGTVTSPAPVRCSEDAFEATSGDELADIWGF
jgi:antitoxin (DNA-binding transcriptional repressor) of toxin-antitoxin stability system